MKAIIYKNGNPLETITQAPQQSASEFFQDCSYQMARYTVDYPDDKIVIQYESLAGITRK